MSKHPSVVLEFEQPIVVMRFVGKTSKEEMLASMDTLNAATTGWPLQVTLCDLTRQTEPINTETRKAVADYPQGTVPGWGTAMFGATFAVRTIATLLMNVLSITAGPNNNITKFFDDEAQARAWLAERIKLGAGG